jgi:hypothetical protein
MKPVKPELFRRFHGLLTIFWVLLWIAAFIFGWLDSVTFVAHLSAIALILGSWSSWQAARVEVKQDGNDSGNGPTT